MLRLLADENVPMIVVTALKADEHDLAWIRTITPGLTDDRVLALAQAQQRVVLTFDKDFGELAFRLGHQVTPGTILLRPRYNTPDYLVKFTRAVLAKACPWEGHFAVAEEGRLRLIPILT